MTALLWLCWLGFGGIVLILIVAGFDEYKSRKCPPYLPDDWMMDPGSGEGERP